MSLKNEHYNIVINEDKSSSSGRLSTQFANSKYKFFGDENEAIQLKQEDHKHHAKYPVYDFRYNLVRLGYKENNKAVPSLNLKLSTAEIVEGYQKSLKLVNNKKRLFVYLPMQQGINVIRSLGGKHFTSD